jgi:hypothetical protein
MADPYVELQITRTQDIQTGKYKLDVVVIRYEEIFPHIFVYRQNLDGTREFHAVATHVELSTFPRGAPVEGNVFYLDVSVALQFDTAQESLDAEAEMIDDVNLLLTNWKKVNGEVNKTYTLICQGE